MVSGVRCTWAPAAGGAGFSAFAADVRTGGDHDALVVVFRGTHARGEWTRYLREVGSLEMEGLQVYSPWVQTLTQVGLG